MDAQEETRARLVSDLVICPKCGQGNAKGERYCSNCGASLANVKAKETASKKKGGVLGKLFGKRN